MPIDPTLLYAQQRRQQRTVAQNPFGPPAATNDSYTGWGGPIMGFLESMGSSLPELIGANPTDEAVAFRAAHPVAGFVSEILPTMVPYAGVYALSTRTAAGVSALAKGMKGAKAAGTALGMNTVNRPIIAGAVKEMLRYSPLELGRLGVGAVVHPENTGELFADVALSTALAGGLGGIGAYFRSGGTVSGALGFKRRSENILEHPVVDLRAVHEPEATILAQDADELARASAFHKAEVLNDEPLVGYLSGKNSKSKIIPLFEGIENGSTKIAHHLNALFRPNTKTVKDRALDKRKLWEGADTDARTLNAGELEPLAKELGFDDSTELATNLLQGRVMTVNSERVANALNKSLDSPAIYSVGDGKFAARTDLGTHVLLLRVGGAEGRPAAKAMGKIDENVTAPASPAEEAAAAMELPPVDETVLDDAGWTPSEIRTWQKGDANAARVEQVRQGHVFRGGDMVPATDELVEATKRMADQRIASLRERMRLFGESNQKLFKPFSDSKGMSKDEALGVLERAIDQEMSMVNKIMRQNERWRFSQNTPVPEVAVKPVRGKRTRKQKIEAQPVLPPSTGPFNAGERWAVVHTDRPGAFVRDLEKLNITAKNSEALYRRVFQPIAAGDNYFRKLENTLMQVVGPLDVARIAKQDKKTWMAQSVKEWGNKGLNEAGLKDSFVLHNLAEQAWDVFAPSMFKERRATLYARLSGLLQNNLRGVREQVNRVVYGVETPKAGARGTLGRNFERIGPDGGDSFIGALQKLSDAEFELVVKAAVTQTPAKDIAKLAADGKISEQAFAAVKRMQELNANYMNTVVLPAMKSVGEKANFDLLEGYIIPRVMLGDWRIPVLKENGELFYLASGKSRGGAERMAKAVVAEAESQGVKLRVGKDSLKHAVEMDFDDMTQIMSKVAQEWDKAPEEALSIVQGAMKRISFINVKRQTKLPFAPRQPASQVYERTGIKGTDQTYTRDEFVKVFENHLTKMGNYAAVQSYMERFGNELFTHLRPGSQKLYEDVMRRAQQAMGIEGKWTNSLNQLLTPVLGPTMGSKAATKIAAATNKTLFAFQLGLLNPTFALLNALSPLQTVLPQLAFVLSGQRSRTMGAEVNRLMHFSPIRDSAGRTVAVGGFLDPMKLMWQSVRQIRHADSELQHIHARLRNDGTLHPMLYEEQTRLIPESLKESFQRGGWAEFLYDGATVMARKSEEFARIISANAGYSVGKQHLGLEGEQLYHFTKRFIESTNYLYGQSDRARLITGPLGSVFGLFKNWQMHFMGMMAVYAGLAFKHNVWAPLLWQSGAAITLGGLGAVPLKHVADGITNMYTDHNDSFLWMQENWGRPWADAAWFGPMGALGVSLQASSTIPGTDVRNDMQMIFNSIAFERAAQLGGAIGDGIAHYRNTGENPLRDNNIRDALIAAATPRAVSRAASVVEGDYVKSMGTGYPQVQDVSFGSKVLHGLGMNAVEIERHQTASRKLWKDQEARKAETTAHGAALADAMREGDYDAVRRIEISAMARGLDVGNDGGIYASAMNVQRREEGDLLDRYKDEMAWRYRNAVGD